MENFYNGEQITPEYPVLVYIEIDTRDNIIKVFSNDFEQPTKTSIKIDEGFGDKFRHAQSQYFEKPLRNEDGSYNYKIENGKICEVGNGK